MNECNWTSQWAYRTNKAAMGSKAGAMRQALIGVAMGLAIALGTTGCHKTAQPAPSTAVDQNSADPADANSVSGNASATGAAQQPVQVLGERAQNQGQQQGEDYSQQQAAPIVRQAPAASQQQATSSGTYASTNNNADDQLSQQQAEALYASDLSDAEAKDPPPPLPDYEQPPAPGPDYLWTPGYWAWNSGGYYWVPGNWVSAPYQGALWTPGYWGFFGGHYRFHHGYWGLHIGYYGGVDYGYGYVGHGYYGGYWNHDHFFYNTTITRVNVNVIRNVYVHPVVVNNVIITGRIGNRVSFNGGRGGLVVQPLPSELHVLQERRLPPMAAQEQIRRDAAQNRQQFFSQNAGRPVIAVAPRPVEADRMLPAELPRTSFPVGQRAGFGNAGPAQPQMRSYQQQPQSQQPVRTIQPSPSVQPHTAPITPQPQPQPQPQSQPQFRSAPQTQTRPLATPPQPITAPRTQPQTAPVVHSQPQIAPSRPTPTVHPQPQVKPKDEEKR